jgi:hypothetical protein
MKETRTVETVNLHDRNPPYQSYRLSYAFKQQLMKSWRPKPTLKCAITVYVIIGLIFFALGIALLVKSNEVFEFQTRYDNLCPVTKGNTTALCAVPFTLTEKVTAPVYFFYKVTNFYQNHRRYVQSIDFTQLNGANYVANQTYSNCDPVVRNSDLFVTKALDGTPLDPQAQAFPCGLVARSLFNDTFTLNYTEGGASTNFVLQENGIAWPDDINYRYKNSNGSYRSFQWADVESQRFMTWMKMAPFMDFRKTWGVIQQDMPAGNYTMFVNSLWDASLFGGEKYLVLSTTNTFGGTNYFLAYAYLAIGGVAILLSILFIIRKMTRPKGMLDKKLREYA